MSCKIVFTTDDGERTMDLDDLPPDVLDRIAVDEGVSTWECFVHPGKSLRRAIAVIDAATEFLGIDPVERPKGRAERKQFLAMFKEQS